MNKLYPLLLPMLVLILPITACRLTTNKLPDEATLSPELEQSQAENSPQIYMLNEESGVFKGEMEINGGGYDIPALVGSRLNFVELGIFARFTRKMLGSPKHASMTGSKYTSGHPASIGWMLITDACIFTRSTRKMHGLSATGELATND